jgi:nucleotide-binding universal stress UspA family protein
MWPAPRDDTLDPHALDRGEDAMILVSYDGSADARAAIDRAAQLMPGAEATIFTGWERFLDMMARNGSMSVGMGFGGAYGDDPRVDEANERRAHDTAAEGVELARAAGLAAQPRIADQRGSVGQAILSAAEAVDADVIVLGTRGRGGVASFLLGSVSHEVIQHADRAVMIVPSGALAERRRGTLHPAEAVT